MENIKNNFMIEVEEHIEKNPNQNFSFKGDFSNSDITTLAKNYPNHRFSYSGEILRVFKNPKTTNQKLQEILSLDFSDQKDGEDFEVLQLLRGLELKSGEYELPKQFWVGKNYEQAQNFLKQVEKFLAKKLPNIKISLHNIEHSKFLIERK